MSDVDPVTRYSDHADAQANVRSALANNWVRNPREVAQQVVSMPLDSLVLLMPKIAGSGFVNLMLAPALVASLFAVVDVADDRLGVELADESERRRR